MIEERYFQKECLTIRWFGKYHNLEKVSIFLLEVYFDYSTSCLHAFFKFQPIFPTPTSKKKRKTTSEPKQYFDRDWILCFSDVITLNDVIKTSYLRFFLSCFFSFYCPFVTPKSTLFC